MIVAGIETSTPQTSVALGTDREIIAAVVLSGTRTHHEAVVPALEQLLRWTGLEIAEITGVTVGTGPGLFTGLRVGVEIAKTLAQTLRIPIVGLPSLDVLAFPARHSRRLVVSVIDARRGEVFACAYRPAPGGVQRESDFMVLTPEGLIAELDATGEDVLLVGNGATLYRDRFEELGSRVDFGSFAVSHPRADALIELAVPRFRREEFDRPFDVVPLYLRKSDAEIAWDRRAGLARD